MSTSQGSSDGDAADRLAAFVEQLHEALSLGENVDLLAMARHHGVGAVEAEECLAGMRALREAVGPSDADISSCLDRVIDGFEGAFAASVPPHLPAEYELIDEIGRGGMGIVYRVRQRSLGRTVALKVLKPGERIFGTALRRFQKEARSLARVRHPHIVPIHEVGEVEGHVYFTMDLIEGQPLSALIKSTTLTPSRATKLLRQVASALTCVHAHGIVHRDLKPANILIDAQDNAYVTDFGLALEVGGDSSLTGTGQIVGTPMYMSPEQARGDRRAIGEATDIYSLGAVLYECLTGVPPFARLAPAEVLYAVMHSDPPLPRRLSRRCPPDLEAICLKAMAKEPARRYPSCAALLEDLERFEAGRSVKARAPGIAARLWRGVVRFRSPIMSAVAAVIAAAFVFAAIGQSRSRSDTELLLATADHLFQLKSYDAAADVFRRVLPEEPTGEESIAIRLKLLECRVHAARQLRAEHRPTDAEVQARTALLELGDLERTPADAARRADPEKLQPIKEDLLWEIVEARADGGSPDGARLALGDFEKAVWFRATSRSRSLPASSPLVTSSAILERLQPAFENPSYPTYPLLLRELRGPREADTRAAIAAMGERAAGLVFTWLREAAKAADQEPVWPPFWAAAGQTSGFQLRDSRVLGKVAEIVGLTDEPRPARLLAARLLGAFADYPPFAPSETVPAGRAELELAATAALAVRVRGMTRDAALREKVAFAIAHLTTGEADPEPLHQWLRRVTGHEPSGVPAAGADRTKALALGWQTWLSAHGTEPPAAWYARALAWNGLPQPSDMAQIVARLAVARGDTVDLLERLLVQLAPDGVDPPARRAGEDGESLLIKWRRALRAKASGDSCRIHAATFARVGGSFGEQPISMASAALETGSGSALTWHTALDFPWYLDAGLTAPGLRPHRAEPCTVMLDSSVLVRIAGEGREASIVIDGVRLQQRWSGGTLTVSSSSGPSELEPGQVAWLPVSARPADPRVPADCIAIACALPLAGGPPPHSLTDWSTRIAAQLNALAEESDQAAQLGDWQFRSREQEPLRNACLLATQLPVPAAIDALKRLQLAHAATTLPDEAGSTSVLQEPFVGLCCAARLLAGDESSLDERRDLIDAVNDGVGSTGGTDTDRRVPQYWARLFATARAPRIRALCVAAFERLHEIRFEEDRAAIRMVLGDAGVPIPPHLAGPDPRSESLIDQFVAQNAGRWLLVGTVALFALGCVAAMANLVVRWAGVRRRIGAAWWLIVCGVILASAHADLAGTDLLADAVGYALAAVGAWVIGRQGHWRGRLVPAVAFGLAAVLDVSGRMFSVPTTIQLSQVAFGAAVLLLPVLSASLAPPDIDARPQPAVPWPYLLLVGVPLLVFNVQSISVAVTGEPARGDLSGGVLTFACALLLSSILWALITLRIRVRQWVPPEAGRSA